MRRRRQTGGLVPRSVTFRLTMRLPPLLFGSTVLAMIPHPLARTPRHLRLLRDGLPDDKRAIERPAAAARRGSGGWPEGSGAASSSGLEDGPDVDVEPGAPMRAEAVGDLAEDHARPQRLFRAVVSRRHRPAGDEDE